MSPSNSFFGTWVVRAAFVLAMFGWGVGFYGPPVFLHAVVARTGWALDLVSFAVTLHFLFGALVVANLPRIHRRVGLPAATLAGAVATAIGVLGWALARAPWQLFVAALLSGGGWVTMGAAGINAIVSAWYARGRPLALAKAYNGASIGGVVFSPLWVALIGALGFAQAALAVGVVMVCVVAWLSRSVFSRTPQTLGQAMDGDVAAVPATSTGAPPPAVRQLPGGLLWRDRRFLTLAAGMACGLFAQIGLIAHLFSLLVPALGAQWAGITMGMATACAIAGRYAVARLMPPHADRRLVICAGYAVQLAGTALLLSAGESQIWLILPGVALFGAGIGNATSLPPLVAQVEFAREDVQRVVALIVAVAQATYAFAPLVFGLVLAHGAAEGVHARAGQGSAVFFAAVGAVQMLTMGIFLWGRKSGLAAMPDATRQARW